MFLKSGASVHSRLMVTFNWTRLTDRGSFAPIRFGALWNHRAKCVHRPRSSDFLILEINVKVLLESILVQVHGVIRLFCRSRLPQAASHMRALAFGNYEEKTYFIVNPNWVIDLLLEGVEFWFQHATRKGNHIKLNNKVMPMCSYVTDIVSEASCFQTP